MNGIFPIVPARSSTTNISSILLPPTCKQRSYTTRTNSVLKCQTAAALDSLRRGDSSTVGTNNSNAGPVHAEERAGRPALGADGVDGEVVVCSPHGWGLRSDHMCSPGGGGDSR